MTAPVKAYLETESGQRIPFLFNPASLDIGRSVVWKPQESPGENAPQLTFDHGSSGSVSMELWFDTTDTGADVTVHTNRLLGLMDVDTQKGRPPWVRLGWGRLSSFKTVVESAQVTFTYFSSQGTPLRASVKLSLKQYQDETRPPLQNPTSGTRKRERLHQVKPGETLDRIAHQAYGDATQWRRIAERNRVLDPFRLRAGTMLVLPEREAASRGA